MKKQFLLIVMILLGLGTSVSVSKAQILKGFGKKLEKKIEEKIDRKADRHVDKTLDKADKKSDETINDALKKSESDSKDNKKNASTSSDPVAIRPDQALVLVGNSCSDLSWFRKGALLSYENIDKKGKLEGGIEMRVLEVSDKGAATVAKIEAKMLSGKNDDFSYPINYICEGDVLYMDIASTMKAMMEKNPEMKSQAAQDVIKNTEIDFSNGFASFPKTMYVGMKLDDLSFSFKSKVGTNEMAFKTLVTDRQVVAKEKISTKAGTFDCLKIRSTSRTSLQVMGMNQKMPESSEYIWIAPKVGLVKQEVHLGKEVTGMQLKEYRN